MRAVRWIAGLAAVLIVGYLTVGGWLVSGMLGRVLTPGEMADPASGGDPVDAEVFGFAYRGDPAAALDTPFEEVGIETPIGAAPAWLIADGAAGNELWAIFVHGIAGAREGGYRYLPTLGAAGIPVLMISYRNDPGAPAAPDGLYSFGLSEWADLDAAASWALANGAQRLVLVGDSMGGGIVGQFLARSEHAGAVAALVLDSPALDFPAVLAGMVRGMGFPLAWGLERVAVAMFAPVHGVDFGAAVVTDEVAAFGGPILLVHGSGDRVVPVAVSDRMVARRHGVTTYLRTEADHISSFRDDREAFEDVLLRFLEGL